MPQQVYTVEIDGTQYSLEGDHPPSEAEARSAIGTSQPKATTPPAAASAGMLDASTATGDPKTRTGADDIRDTLQWGGKVLAGMMGMNAPGVLSPGIDAVNNPKTTLATAAVPVVAQAAMRQVPGVIEGGKRLAGISKLRAGTNMQAAAEAAKDTVVNTDAAANAGLRAMDLQSAGARMPRAATQFMARATSGDGLSFQEAQDFASNLSRLSANEFNSLNPQMQRAVSEMAAKVREGLQAAAESAGAGDKYAQGVKEYGKAMNAAKTWDTSIKPALTATLRRIAQAAGAGGAFEIGRRSLD